MNDIITFELIEDKGLQKFYKSSKILTRGFNRLLGKYTEYNKEKEVERVKEEYHKFFPEEGFNYICISNARAHLEKLAFAAIYFNNELGRINLQLEGRHTFLIDGGNSEACWDDEKYLRLIARHNGYSQNNVIII